MKPLVAALFLAAAAGPVLADTLPPIMPVYGVTTDGRGVTVRMPAIGCTALKSDFTVAVAKSDQRPMLLIARRSRTQSLAACAAPTPPVAITWSYQDLGLDPKQPFVLANPLTADPGQP